MNVNNSFFHPFRERENWGGWKTGCRYDKNRENSPGTSLCGAAAAAVRLSRTEAVVYRAASETRISCGMGMSVLSASTDGETYQRFYLDKPAIIRKGVYFLFEPFQGEATVMVSDQETPEELGRHAPGSARVDNKLRVESI